MSVDVRGRRLRGAVFDFGGVLTQPLFRSIDRSTLDPALLGVLAFFLQELQEVYHLTEVTHDLHLMEVGRLDEDEFFRRLCRRHADQGGEELDPATVQAAVFGRPLQPSTTMIDVVRRVRGIGLRTAMLTNLARGHDRFWRALLDPDELFDVVVESAVVGLRKPDPAIYRLTCDRLGLPPEECLFVDDVESNVEAARSLGMTGMLCPDPEVTAGAVWRLLGRHLVTAGGTVEASGWSEVGPVRAENQDRWECLLLGPASALVLLADGMGGHAGGADAARLAVDAARDTLLAADAPDQALEEAVGSANAAVAAHVRRLGQPSGTTLVILLLQGGRCHVAHVGDSRAYLLRRGRAEPLTTDHSWVEDQVQLGRLSPAVAARDPRRNILTRALMGAPVSADLTTIAVEPHDLVLALSNGAWEPLGAAGIAVAGGGDGVSSAVRRLCADALAAGATDNVTVAGLRVPALA